jgi:hypothetical protein
MKNNTDNHLDKLSKKVMQESLLEAPSLDFTANVMSQINALKVSEITVYKPLISKMGWFVIATVVVSISGYFVFNNTLEGINWFNTIDFSIITNNKITEALSGFTLSNKTVYAVVLFGIMLFIQIPILKKRFDEELVV